MNEIKCIELCLRNDRRAQKELVSHYAPVLLTVARRYTYSAIEPQDILQDSFLQIFNHLSQFDISKGKLINWMKQIVINTALKHFRSEKSRMNGNHSPSELNEDIQVGEVEFLNGIDAEHWVYYIQKLPTIYRQVFNLSAIDGYTHEEIAEILNLEISTSRSHLHRARKMLVSIIEEKKVLENGSERN